MFDKTKSQQYRRSHRKSRQSVIHITLKSSSSKRGGSIKRKYIQQKSDTTPSTSTSEIIEHKVAFNNVNNTTDKNICIKEHHRRKKQTSKYCSRRRLLRIIFFSFCILILCTAVTALLVGLLIKQETTKQTTATTVTTTTPKFRLFTSSNITVFGIWNTTAGGDSSPSTSGSGMGNYIPGEGPLAIFDNLNQTKYTSLGACTAGMYALNCGENTGLYFISHDGPVLLISVQFRTANNIIERDPLTTTIEGSNQPSALLTLGSSWTLLYSGTTGLDSILDRHTWGPAQLVWANSIWYSSFRILITSKRGVEIGTQYCEVKLNAY